MHPEITNEPCTCDGAVANGLGGDPLEEELADAAIRLLVMLHDLTGGEWSDGRIRCRRPTLATRHERIEVLVWPIIARVCDAAERWRRDERSDVLIDLELAVLEVYRLADCVGVDLTAAIVAKSEKNKGRGALHGKSRADG
jgi:hypothetical protein